TGELLVSASNNSGSIPRQDLETLSHIEISESGWYRFEHQFHEVAGQLSVDLLLIDETGTVLWSTTLSSPDDTIGEDGTVGGNRYCWFPVLSVDGGVAVAGRVLVRTAAATVAASDGSASAAGTIAFADVDLSDVHTVAASAVGQGYLGVFAVEIGDA